jgi:hypothetical protein
LPRESERRTTPVQRAAPAPSAESVGLGLPSDARLPLAAGIAALWLLVGGLGLWAVHAKIAGAVVTSGIVQVQSNRQVISTSMAGSSA